MKNLGVMTKKYILELEVCPIVNRPGVAEAVLETALPLINLLIPGSFVEISSEHLHSQELGS